MTDSVLHNRIAESQGLETAVVLAVPGPTATPGSAGPLTRVGGLTLFQRTLLTLQRAGIGQALVLVGDEEVALRALVREDPRVRLAIRWLPTREFPPDDPQTWETVLGERRGYCLVVGATTLFSRELVERLRREVQDGQPSLLLCRASKGEAHAGGGAAAGPAEVIVLRTGLAASSSLRAGGAEETAGWPTARGRGEESRSLSGRDWVRGLIARADAEGGLRMLPVPADSSCWLREVRDVADARLAERSLLESLKGHFEGFVDRHFNRKLSALFTRFFFRAGLSANAVTALATLIGLLAASAIAHGTYLAGLVGALLFQLSAVVDCCDGEIARLTFTESKLGEQLDLLGDNLVHMAIFAGMSWAVFLQQGGWQSGVAAAWGPLALGGAAILANGLSLWLVMRAKALRDRGAIVDPAAAARVEFLLRNMASRDFSAIVLAFALLGRLDIFLWLAAIGANAFWVTLAWVTRPSAISRA